MATTIQKDKDLDALVLKEADEKLMLDVRRTFLLRQGAMPKLPAALSAAISNRGITYWEQLGCVGYNPELSLLEATIVVKRPTGYSGNLCGTGSLEYVRFFIDWEDGSGWHDAGVSSVRVHDVSDAPAGDQHPLAYLVTHRIDVERRKRPCNTRRLLLPKVRGVLSWNTLPPTNPNQLPLYGNRVDTRIQIAPKRQLFFKDLKALEIDAATSAVLAPFFDSATAVTFKPQPATIEELLPVYRKAQIPDHRLVTGTHPAVFAKQQAKISATPVSLSELAKIDIDIDTVLGNISAATASTAFEQLTCVGFSPLDDTLGAVIRIKQESGYNGTLCRRGSPEYVAFWADWDNDGTFDQYLGTASVVLHDLPRAGDNVPLDYAVRLYSPEFSERLRNCRAPNVVGIRAVLSWSTPPSTSDPNDLETWGNRLDTRVVLRPGEAVKGDEVGCVLIAVGGVDPDDISTDGLAYPTVGAPGGSHFCPWGGYMNIRAMLYNTGPARSTWYKVEYSKRGEEDWHPVTASQTYSVINPLHWWDPVYPQTETAVNGWLPYIEDLSVPIEIDQDIIATWYTSAVDDGPYDLRLLYTKADPHLSPAGTELTRVKVTICNLEFVYHPTVGGTALDATATLDVVISGGGCQLYKKSGTPPPPPIPGLLKVVHPYFGSYDLDLQPDSASTIEPTPGQPTTCQFLGDDGPEAGTWTLNPVDLNPCGYTVRLQGWDRTLVNDGSTHHYGVKYVGFAVF